MAYTAAQNKATQKYQAANLEQVRVWVKKGAKARYKAHAESLGKSLNAYVVELIEADIAKHSVE